MKNQSSLLELEKFWEKQAEQLPWFSKWDKGLIWDEPYAHWFAGGTLNASYACLDVHQKTAKKNKVAIYWQDEQGNNRALSYAQLYKLVNQYASILRRFGVKKGDIVLLYLPMIPEAVAAMLAVARLGATHTVVFSGFSATALKNRIDDAHVKFIITADVTYRRGKYLRLKDVVDKALVESPSVDNVFVIKRLDDGCNIQQGRDIIMDEKMATENFVEPEHVESNHPLFILYTSGTTGKPKGIIHSTGGYLTYVYSTIKWAFDVNDESVYWCTADIGWITGHSYVVYAPLMHGATMVLYEGAPDYPAPDQWWKLIATYGVTIFYTSPTALRMFMRYDPRMIERHDLSSLKILGSVGEPINPEVWQWYNRHIGRLRCPIIDTWWQTETGGFMISPQAGVDLLALKPGSATEPLPGVDADVVDVQGKSVPRGSKGYLVIRKPWPGMMIGIYQDPECFKEAYWSKFKGAYYAGDYAIKDSDGYFWLLGRADEVLNIGGHRVGTIEIESGAVSHQSVAEAAAVGIQHPIKGEGVVVFAILKQGYCADEQLQEAVTQAVRAHIGAFATPCGVYFVESLPKTRSGKIMRRVLKAVFEGAGVGDVSTLEDEASVDEIRLVFQKLQVQIRQLG